MRARSLLLPVVLAAGFLAGCTAAGPTTPAATTTPPGPADNGVSALSADEIMTKATEALKTASSFRMKGSLEQEGAAVTVDFVGSGDNVKGTMTAQGMAIEILKVDGVVYLKADALWTTMLGAVIQDDTQRETVLGMLKGKYVKVPANNETFKQFDVDAKDVLDGGAPFTKGEATTINGTPALTITDSKGNKVYVATTGEPYPLRFEDSGGNKIEVTEIGAGATITAPNAAEVVDLAQLAQLGS